MKHSLLIALLLVSSAINAKDVFSLKVHVPARYQNIHFTIAAATDSIADIAITQPANGIFLINGNLINDYAMATLSATKQDTLVLYKLICIKADAADLILTEEAFDTKSLILKGANLPFAKVISQYESQRKAYTDSMSEIAREHQFMRIKGVSLDSQNVLTALMSDIKKRFEYFKIGFISKHADAYPSLLFFYRDILFGVSSQTNLTADTLTQTLLLFPEKNTNSFPGNLIKKELGKRNNVQLLKPAPDFSILTNAKEIFRLSDHKGTLTFLGFWTAGCKGCVESFPILRILDSTYSGKGLRMISVSLDQTEEVWKNALARYKLKWTQALDLSSFRKDTPTPIHELYNIGYYPQYFLVDNNGTIIYHNELSDDDLQYSKLRSIINSKLSKSE